MGWRDFLLPSMLPPPPAPATAAQFPVESSPRDTTFPLRPGWLVVYRDRESRLRGGYEDREHGTVLTCEWDSYQWTVILTDGHRLPLASIRSVAQTNNQGEILAAWTVREHGVDGQRHQ